MRHTNWFYVLCLALGLFLSACAGNGPNTPEVPESTGVIREDVDVRVLSEEGRNNLTTFNLDATTGAGELRFREGDPAVAALEPGFILVSEPVPGAAPAGFLQRIETKRLEGDEIIFETTQAALTDVFEKATIRLEQELEPEDVVDPQLLYQGMSYQSAADVGELRPQASVGFDHTITFNEVLIDQDDDKSTTDDQLRIDGSFSFDARASAGIDIDCCESIIFPYLDSLYGKVRLEESVDINLTGALKTSFDERFEVARLYFGSFTVPVGPVPVVFVLDMVISVGASGEFTATLEAGATQELTVQVGIEYTDDDGWRDLNEFDFDFDVPTPEITATASAKAFLRPQFNVKIYGLAGPYLYAEAFVAADAELYRDPFWRLSAGMDFGIGFVIDLPVVGEIAKYDQELAGFEETIGESENSAPEVTISSPEDGFRTFEASGFTIYAGVTDFEQESVPVTLTETIKPLGQLGTKTAVGNDSAKFGVSDLCAGTYAFEAVAKDDQGKEGSDSISVTVENFVPEVSVREDAIEPTWLFPGGRLLGFADIVDRVCSSASPADPALTAWYVDGKRVGSTDELFYSLNPNVYNAGDTLTLEARYDDGGDEGRSETVEVTLQAPPADGEVVTPITTIREPKNGDRFGPTNWSGICTSNNPTPDWAKIRAVGTSYDINEGRLAGDTFVWEISGGSGFVEVARGERVSIDPCVVYDPRATYSLRLTATNGDGESSSQTIRIVLLELE